MPAVRCSRVEDDKRQHESAPTSTSSATHRRKSIASLREYPTGRALFLRSASCTVAVMCRATAAISAMRTGHKNSPMRVQEMAVGIELLGAIKNLQIPSKCPTTNANRIAPVTAITIFLPFVDSQKLAARFSRSFTAVVLIEFFPIYLDESRTFLIPNVSCSSYLRWCARYLTQRDFNSACGKQCGCPIVVETLEESTSIIGVEDSERQGMRSIEDRPKQPQTRRNIRPRYRIETIARFKPTITRA